VDNGSRLRVKGEGEGGSAGRGDLYVVVEIPRHPSFQREGSDLIVEATVGLAKAILGTEIRVPTIDGGVMMKIPAGTQSGSTFRLRGKGMPKLRGRGRGDEMVKVNVEIPRRLSERQKDLIREFEKSAGG